MNSSYRPRSAIYRAGQPLSRESQFIPAADAFQIAEGHTVGHANASAAWSETLTCADAPCTGTGRSRVWPSTWRTMASGVMATFGGGPRDRVDGRFAELRGARRQASAHYAGITRYAGPACTSPHIGAPLASQATGGPSRRRLHWNGSAAAERRVAVRRWPVPGGRELGAVQELDAM
jgi:hypothetical protein